MDKMELKYLCGYLSYELRIKWGERIIKMNTGQGSSRYWIGISSLLKWYNSDMIEKPVPLLLPLSDLTEPLQDGSIHIVELAKIAFPDEKWIREGDIAISNEGLWFWYNTESFGFSCDGKIDNYVPNQLQCFEYLYSIHADIHGLIPSGLAFDKRNFKI